MSRLRVFKSAMPKQVCGKKLLEMCFSKRSSVVENIACAASDAHVLQTRNRLM